ncbi:MFS transporter [Streptococcus macacae]|uniref:Transporter, major facilitator family protein n=1 Tax=Streptococcus macacae NCTC 11558 TaxID=764298 RepID=G5JV42_9STRE|nr:MFS transporter [Streptococcus macacae]EHJ52547.1 transporter, major facilitator family protein [Streptococcus macacae NCTC 11558]SUN77668.1 Major Facilitator Superfamily protein [Streptococcus macacae NCTC 11558]
MKKLMEKMSLLSLSFMLVSTFSVSPALPKMIAYYQTYGYTASQVEGLISLPSFAILAVLLLNPWVNRILPERLIIIVSLLLLSTGGILPVFIQLYPLVFLSRLLLGVGIGLINAHAINIISERYFGKERIQMLGIRSSIEVLGSAVLTFLAGQFLVFSWTFAFLIYGFGFLIFIVYFGIIPKTQKREKEQDKQINVQFKEGFTFRQWLYILGLASYAGFVILINSANTLRIPILVEKLSLGTARQASFILSLMMLMGILAGILFSPLLQWFKDWLMLMITLALGLGMLVLWQAASFLLLSTGALIVGFVYSLGVTLVFHKLSETVLKKQLATATTVALIGCNLGGACASFVLHLLAAYGFSEPKDSFGIFAALSFLLSFLLFMPFMMRTVIGSRK